MLNRRDGSVGPGEKGVGEIAKAIQSPVCQATRMLRRHSAGFNLWSLKPAELIGELLIGQIMLSWTPAAPSGHSPNIICHHAR